MGESTAVIFTNQLGLNEERTSAKLTVAKAIKLGHSIVGSCPKFLQVSRNLGVNIVEDLRLQYLAIEGETLLNQP